MSFSENLQNLRQMKGFSQEQLAEKLEVSRQAVSKWESGSGYPETEKIISICEIFDCSMDTLMKGKISADIVEDKNEYDTFYNKYSKGIAAGVGIILIGATILISLSGFNNNAVDTLGLIFLMVCVLVAVPIFIYLGIRNEDFKKSKVKMAEIYKPEEIQSFSKKFPIMISAGVALILVGVIILIALYGMRVVNDDSTIPITILLSLVTIAVPIFIYAGLQKNKYDINQYNEENEFNVDKTQSKKVNKISEVIMLIATFIFLALGFTLNLWHIAWIVFPLCGILCAIVEAIERE